MKINLSKRLRSLLNALYIHPFLQAGFLFLVLLLGFTSCSESEQSAGYEYKALTGAKIIDGRGGLPIINGVILIQEGRIMEVGPANEIELPANTEIINVSGKTIVPGLINSHAHVGYEGSMNEEDYSKENIIDQLKLYARYGITTVVSLGEDREEAVPFRNEVDTAETPLSSRLYIAGAIVTGDTPQEAIRIVDENAKMGVDFMKIRVDDNLGSSEKMSEEVYQKVINRSHDYNLKLAAHMYYLEDAKKLLRAGADFMAHSVRDQEVDTTFINLMKENDVCYCPTLTRDLSTFIYENEPPFFNDPYFLKGVEPQQLETLKDPEYQRKVRENPNNKKLKQGLQVAMFNLMTLAEVDVKIAMGTDSGVPTRFQGYFEHLEMNMMAEAGMQQMDIILAATKNPAECLGLKDVGTLEEGKWADLLVLDQDPLLDISFMRTISSVYIGGERIEP